MYSKIWEAIDYSFKCKQQQLFACTVTHDIIAKSNYIIIMIIIMYVDDVVMK